MRMTVHSSPEFIQNMFICFDCGSPVTESGNGFLQEIILSDYPDNAKNYLR